MADRVSRTAHDDAPLSAAKKPDAAATDLLARSDDTLLGHTVCIDRPREELYAFWRDPSNLALFMENIQSVTPKSATRTHWVVAAPAGRSVEWDAEITEDVPGERIAWTSLEGADVRNSGAVRFRDSPTGRGTFVTVTIAYDPPAGEIGRLIAKLFQREPKIQARQDLRRFKQLMETGEIPTATRYIGASPPR
jgi:uncharacterized membrane protein